MIVDSLRVSIHAPARGATSAENSANYDPMFQSTHPRGVRPGKPKSFKSDISFNPRTREGCDFQGHADRIALRVSIHAPARGATGASLITVLNPWFQSTHPRGVRQAKYKRYMQSDPVSIHAPARGATHDAAKLKPPIPVSIHAPARGATWCFSRYYCFSRFQSTHPRGVRQVITGQQRNGLMFQSTHPRGVRQKVLPQLAPGL